MKIWSADTSKIAVSSEVKIGTKQGPVLEWSSNGIRFHSRTTHEIVNAKFTEPALRVLVKVEPWRIVHSPAQASLKEEFALLEGTDVAGVFESQLYTGMALAGRILLEELAAAEGVMVEDLVKDILDRNKISHNL